MRFYFFHASKIKQNSIFFIGIIFILIFFIPLFFPQSQIYYSPDRYASDTLHFHLPVKHLLRQSLQAGKIPIWTDLMGTGFPILAEGQIGALYLPNLILFSFFSTVVAFNLSYVFLTIICYLGMYLLLRHYGRSRAIAAFFALTFSLSGFFAVHYNHLTMIQTISWLPLIIYVTEKLYQKKTYFLVAILSILIALQITAGYFQMSFMTLLLASLLFGYRFFETYQAKKVIKKKSLILFGLSLILGFLLAAPQLLPTFELYSLSQKAEGNVEIDKYFYPYDFFITWIRPYWFGSHADASYDIQQRPTVFLWENIFYIGLVPIALFLYRLLKKDSKSDKIWILLALLFVGLGLGKSGPLFFIFDLPIFSSFRVPSRYMLVTAFCILVSTSGTYEKIIKNLPSHKALLVHFCLLLSFVELLNFSYHYNALIPSSQIFSSSELISDIENDKRIIRYVQNEYPWTNEFEDHGWQRPEYYMWLLNGTRLNSNILWDQPNFSEYSGISTERQGLMQVALSKNVLDVSNVEYVISSEVLDRSLYSLEASDSSELVEAPTFRLYRNLNALPRFRMIYKTEKVSDPHEAYRVLYDDSFDAKLIGLVEDDSLILDGTGSARVKVIENETQSQVFEVDTDEIGLFIVADTFYPGWQAYLNEQETGVFPVNGNQRGVFIPKGMHTLRFEYQPRKLEIGKVISVVSAIFLVCLIFIEQRKFVKE